MQKMKEIDKIKNDNKEILEAREAAYNRMTAAMLAKGKYLEKFGTYPQYLDKFRTYSQ